MCKSAYSSVAHCSSNAGLWTEMHVDTRDSNKVVCACVCLYGWIIFTYLCESSGLYCIASLTASLTMYLFVSCCTFIALYSFVYLPVYSILFLHSLRTSSYTSYVKTLSVLLLCVSLFCICIVAFTEFVIIKLALRICKFALYLPCSGAGVNSYHPNLAHS